MKKLLSALILAIGVLVSFSVVASSNDVEFVSAVALIEQRNNFEGARPLWVNERLGVGLGASLEIEDLCKTALKNIDVGGKAEVGWRNYNHQKKQ